MTYREIGISIRSAYSQGWPDDISQRAFRTETRKLFRDAGWQVEETPLESGHCDTVRNGKDALYLHPTVFSGVMREDHITALQRLLDEANTFRTLETRLYRECFDLTDEELAGMMVFAKKVAKAIKKSVPCQRVGVAVLGLDVPHAHIHLVPLVEGNELNFSNPKKQFPKEEMEVCAKLINSNL